MKIVHIIPTLNEGGGERFVVDLCNELSERPEVSVYLITLFDITEKMFLAQNISPKVNVHSLGKKLGFDYKIIYRLFRLIGKIKPDIINTHLKTIEYNILNVIFRKKIKYFHTLHNDAIIECPSSKLRKVRGWFYKKGIIKPITISDISAQSFREKYKLSNDILIYNGRSPLRKSIKFKEVEKEFEKYRKTNDTKVFLNIASVMPIKNQVALIESFNKHLKEGKDVTLLMIGRYYPGNEEFLEKVKESDKERIFHLGVKNNVEDYLSLADAFCLSSKMEGMPITIIEAFSAGCIPVCTPVGGIPNMIKNKKTGVLGKGIRTKDIYEMIESFLLLKEEEKEKIEKNIQTEFWNKYAIETCTANYINAYNK